MMAIILAAGVGRRLRDYTVDPKCLLEFGGRSLIHNYLDALSEPETGVTEVGIVIGYRGDLIKRHVQEHAFGGAVSFKTNPEYEKGSALSLLAAYENFDINGDTLLMDGDVYFEPPLMRRLMKSSDPNAMLVDSSSVNTGEEIMMGIDNGRVVAVGRGMDGAFDIHGEWIGFMKMDGDGSRKFQGAVKRLVEEQGDGVGYEDAIHRLCNTVSMGCERVHDLRWIEIDTPEDVARARSLAEQSSA
ncbi:MAG: phosphocholine cytidylyltransferase family protein [SAR202 cluster bacterium]|nr:phosphocholine cytidylyltransferase family protein [SAR202 cluster bacterium]|tara:strand:+ start:4691 stop:5422 length:732 start_codon:yes stop_codon:yes gene_type:complete